MPVAPQDCVTWKPLLDAALPPGVPVCFCRSLDLGPEPRNVTSARAFVVDQLPQMAEEAREEMRLLTSELATNAVVHARTSMIVVVVLTEQDVVVGVHDSDLGRSEEITHERDGGRGLSIVSALASAHGMVRHPQGGKTAWFRRPLVDGAA